MQFHHGGGDGAVRDDCDDDDDDADGDGDEDGDDIEDDIMMTMVMMMLMMMMTIMTTMMMMMMRAMIIVATRRSVGVRFSVIFIAISLLGIDFGCKGCCLYTTSDGQYSGSQNRPHTTGYASHYVFRCVSVSRGRTSSS